MGSLFKTSTPAAPDPVATANAQSAANEETARLQAKLNRVNQTNPFGSVTYNDLGNDQYEQVTSYAPDVQRALEAQNSLTAGTSQLALDQLGRIQSNVSQPFSFDGLPQISGQQDLAADSQRVSDALFNQAQSRLNPRFDQEQRAIETRLINQGIPVGSAAYNEAINNFNLAKNDAYTSAQNSAIAAGGAEQSRLFGLETAARQQGINEALTLRNQPINEIAALLGTGGVAQPQFAPVAQTGVAPTDVIGATSLGYQGQLANAQAKNAQSQGLMGGLFGLGGSAIMASDRRLKKDIVKVGTLNNGLNIYRYTYKWDNVPQIGVMADEVEAILPQAVSESADGFKQVDYGIVTLDATGGTHALQ